MSRDTATLDLLGAPEPLPPPDIARVVKRRTTGKATLLSTVDDLLCSVPLRAWSITELRGELRKRGWPNVLDTSISARIRELRRSPYSRHVSTRTRAGTSHVVEYAVGEVTP